MLGSDLRCFSERDEAEITFLVLARVFVEMKVCVADLAVVSAVAVVLAYKAPGTTSTDELPQVVPNGGHHHPDELDRLHATGGETGLT